ncbi:MAG: thrombospondin type 3 repeat-containing protein [Bacteroidetes bacterium OLB9]|nr:MAG: thrombospondin type 3 repeat-containing protein [Bacteroidetes bacterium OLB9]MCZ2339816.1 DUF6089 family protein [Chitinophagales bacterium]
MKIQYKIFFCILGCMLLVSESRAQRGYELGGWIGMSSYFGDLNTELKIVKPGLALGIIARRNINSRITLRTSLNYGRVGADDANSKNNFERNRNLSFRSNIFDWSNVIEFNFFSYEHGHPTYNKTPYFFGGFNIFHYNPTAELDGRRYQLRKLGTEGQPLGKEYASISAGLILGGGFKFDINRDVSVNIEVSTRFLKTDYLDDVSSVYPDKQTLGDTRGPIAVALSDRSLVEGQGASGRQRGDTKSNDRYAFFGVSVMRYFGGIQCPEISKIR